MSANIYPPQARGERIEGRASAEREREREKKRPFISLETHAVWAREREGEREKSMTTRESSTFRPGRSRFF